tara:strand:- start:2662 stop:2937 length:276 start_codon:yes stop_codon:yes gene_type:complete
MDSNKEKKVTSIDGHIRSPERETEINLHFLSTFISPAGKAVLQYLRSITIESVAGPAISDSELRHREGMRFVVGLIETRIKGGEYERNKSK